MFLDALLQVRKFFLLKYACSLFTNKQAPGTLSAYLSYIKYGEKIFRNRFRRIGGSALKRSPGSNTLN